MSQFPVVFRLPAFSERRQAESESYALAGAVWWLPKRKGERKFTQTALSPTGLLSRRSTTRSATTSMSRAEFLAGGSHPRDGLLHRRHRLARPARCALCSRGRESRRPRPRRLKTPGRELGGPRSRGTSSPSLTRRTAAPPSSSATGPRSSRVASTRSSPRRAPRSSARRFARSARTRTPRGGCGRRVRSASISSSSSRVAISSASFSALSGTTAGLAPIAGSASRPRSRATKRTPRP